MNFILRIFEKNKINKAISSLNFGVYHPHSPSQTAGLLQPKILDKKKRSAKYFPRRKRPSRANVHEQLTLSTIVRGYQIRGHLAAVIDPLNIKRRKSFRPEFPTRIVVRQHRLPVDREKLYLIPANTYLGSGECRMLLGDIIERLNDAYCHTMGIEYMYDPLQRPRDWLREEIECADKVFLTPKEKIDILRRLVAVEAFEVFLKDKLPEDIRLSVAGLETGIIALQELISAACEKGADTIVIGMRRTGRLAVLAGVLKKPLDEIFSLITPLDRGLAKYTYGAYSELPISEESGGVARVSLCATSSATPEAFYPFILGKVKGMQWHEYDTKGDRIIPVVIHGMRELNAQGIVYETLKLIPNREFYPYGAVHFVFGTRPDYQHEENDPTLTQYCTDVVKVINAPVFHINADDVEKVINAVHIAVKFRKKFKRSSVIHIVGYNRWINLKPPMTYKEIIRHEATKATDPVTLQYAKQLINNQILTEKEFEKILASEKTKLEEAWKVAQESKKSFDEQKWSDIVESQMFGKKKLAEPSSRKKITTGFDKEKLIKYAKALSTEPIGFELAPADAIKLKQSSNMVDRNSLDWIMCESLAFASLIEEGTPIRINGADVNRRRHIFKEMTDEEFPRCINMIESLFNFKSKCYIVCDRSHSLYATLAFQVGFALGDYNSFVIWEAPVGDKVSKAQPVLDSFIACAKHKLRRECSIVMYIPHGSKCVDTFTSCNGRPERFLELCFDDDTEVLLDMSKQLEEINMIVVFPSTAASFFHALRRHKILTTKRPLVIFIPPNINDTPPASRSSFEELSGDTSFQPFIGDLSIKNTDKVRKIIFCTGGIYIDLAAERLKRQLTEAVAICRIEQISPFPYKSIKDEMERYKYFENICWVQEEPRNQGWWSYVQPRLWKATGGVKDIEVSGRYPHPDSGWVFRPDCLIEKRNIFNEAFALSFG